MIFMISCYIFSVLFHNIACYSEYCVWSYWTPGVFSFTMYNSRFLQLYKTTQKSRSYILKFSTMKIVFFIIPKCLKMKTLLISIIPIWYVTNILRIFPNFLKILELHHFICVDNVVSTLCISSVKGCIKMRGIISCWISYRYVIGVKVIYTKIRMSYTYHLPLKSNKLFLFLI